MSQAPKAGSDDTFEIRLPDLKTFPAPLAANWCQMTWTNLDSQLLVGYIDTTERVVKRQLGEKVSSTLVPHIHARFALSIRGFAVLLANVREAEKALKAQGVPVDDIIEQMLGKR